MWHWAKCLAVLCKIRIVWKAQSAWEKRLTSKLVFKKKKEVVIIYVIVFLGELTKKIHVNYLVLCLINSKHFFKMHTHINTFSNSKEEVSSWKKLGSSDLKWIERGIKGDMTKNENERLSQTSKDGVLKG